MNSSITYQQLFTVMHVKPLEFRQGTEDGWHALTDNQQALTLLIPEHSLSFKCKCDRCESTVYLTFNYQ